MKKFRYVICTALILTFSMIFMSACDFGSKYEQFEISYTKNLEFLIGEEFYDAGLTGTATLKNGKEEDVTEKMDVDTSAYNKNQAGTYKIYCEFEDVRLSFEVKVVEEITNVAAVYARMQNVANNTFKRDENGVFSYEASNSTEFQSSQFDEDLIYIDDDGQISAYLTWSLDSSVTAEFWYQGTEEVGTLTVRSDDGSGVKVTSEASSLQGFAMGLVMASMTDELPISVYPMPYNDEGFDFDGTSVSLVKEADETYVLTVVEVDEYDEYETVIEYKNDVLVSMDGVAYTFPKTEAAVIPTVPEATPAPVE